MYGAIKTIPRFRYLALWCLLLSATLSMAAPPRLSKDLRHVSSKQWVNVIVQYRVPPTQSEFKQVVIKGGSPQENLPLIRGGAFTVKASSLSTLANDPNVVYVSPNRTVTATATVTDFYDQAVLAPYAWSQSLNGSGIGVAVIDSGIASSKDFSLRPARVRVSSTTRVLSAVRLRPATCTDMAPMSPELLPAMGRTPKARLIPRPSKALLTT